MSTVYNKYLSESVDINCHSIVEYLTNEYNFSVSPFREDDDTYGVVFSNTYDNNEDYKSRFFLSIDDAMKLGQALIDKSIEMKNYNDILVERYRCIERLFDDIYKGRVDTLVVKLHKKKYVLSEDPSYHIFNIYPIYNDKNRINDHFNFNLPLRIVYGDYNGIKNIKEYVSTLFNLNINYDMYDDSDIEIIKELSDKYPGLINGFKKVKLKLVNCKQELKKDEQRELEKISKMKNNKSDNNKPAYNKEALQNIINSMPKKADGTIDFNEVMRRYVPEV